MKKTLLLLFPLLIFSSWLSAAVLTVNNNPGSVAMYSSLFTAIAEADPGDTILIAPSPTLYGDHHIYKQLHFVGGGYFLSANSIPGLNDNHTYAHLRFKQDNSLGDSSGSSASGIKGLISSSAGVSSLSIDKCTSDGNGWDFTGPVTVTRSYLPSTMEVRHGTSTISNSIISHIRLRTSGIAVTNCVIKQQINGGVTGTSFTNTIFQTTNGSHWDNDPTFTFCINIGAGFLPSGDGNINNQLVTNVFTIEDSNTRDRYFQLSEGSVAIGAGFGGDDIGAFGGSNPYVLSGVPGLPRMTRFNAPGTATGLTAVTVEVEAEAFPE